MGKYQKRPSSSLPKLVVWGRNSADCASNSVVTSNPSRRSAADMSRASLSAFGSRPMWA